MKDFYDAVISVIHSDLFKRDHPKIVLLSKLNLE